MSDTTRFLPLTERNNSATRNLDVLPTRDMLALINNEDARIAAAVQTQLPAISSAVDAITVRLQAGGRLVYVGAGTSGRLGVLDASEMPPTFGVSPDLVIGIIAGGDRALRNPIEGAEDDTLQGQIDLSAIFLTARDCVVGLAASGRTPYVVGALSYAREIGALTVSLACSYPAPVHQAASINISPDVGPEVISGSTRMKSGTAQKMVLNMISTGVMIRLGKTFGNLMVDVRATNTKLRERAHRIVAEICDLSIEDAGSLLLQTDGSVKPAIVMSRAHCTLPQAQAALLTASGSVRAALDLLKG